MTASLGLWISFISMLTFPPGYLGLRWITVQCPKEPTMIKELFTKILIFTGIFGKKSTLRFQGHLLPFLNINFYFWKTNLRRITQPFHMHACMEVVQGVNTLDFTSPCLTQS